MDNTILNEKIKDLNDMYEYRKYLFKNPILNQLFLEVTSRCNARCEHCGSRCDGKEQGKELSLEKFKKVLDDISKKYNPRKVFLNVTGGEPLVRKDLFELLNYANKLGYPWGMTSNGMLINKRMLKKLEEANMASVSISIDGLEKTHEEFRKVPNSFKKILNGLKLMLDSDVIKVVQVTTVVNKKNIHELEDIYKLLLDLGIKYWRVVNCDPIGRAIDNNGILLDNKDYIYLFNFIKEKRNEGKMIDVSYGCSHYVGISLEKELRSHNFICMAGVNIASILSNGDIYVCPNVPRVKDLIQGNVNHDNFVEVWEKKFDYFRNENRTSCRKCKRCKEWKYCLGDSLHTWNFDEKKPNICLREVFKKFK